MKVYIVYQERHLKYGYFKQELERVYMDKSEAKEYIKERNAHPTSNHRYLKTKEVINKGETK